MHWTSSHPKTKGREAEAGSVRKAARRADEPRVAEPGAAPQHPERALTRTVRINPWYVVVRAVPILTPLVHIAEHVEETKRVWKLPTHRPRVRLRMGVLAVPPVPSDVIEQRRLLLPAEVEVTNPSGRGRAAPARVLPLGLSRQPS